jgi:ribosomal protein S12 methylthiotransferase
MRTNLKKKKINIVTLGCSKNVYDSENLMGQLAYNGYEVTHNADVGDIVIINTCGFIHDAKQESIDTILSAIHDKQTGRIDKVYVTGCLSERYKEELPEEIPEVDQYFGTHDMIELLKKFNVDYKHELIGERKLTTPQHYAYLKISEGCDRSCSFCAIPMIRGKHISRSIESLVSETEKLAEKGVKELILIAQDLTFYGLDIYGKRHLNDLLKALVKVEGIEWIRLHYAFPTGFPEEVIKTIASEEKICNYLDIPLQHVNNEILQSMRRGHSRKVTENLIQKLRTNIPDVAIRTTLIVGYPGETAEKFKELKQWVAETRFDRLGVFTYSHEENTYAGNLIDDVSEAEKQKRVEEIMNLQSQISYEKNQEKVGKTLKCIFDRKENNFYIGRTEYDSPEVDNEVRVDASKFAITIGKFISVKITSATEFDLFGEPVYQ